MNDRPPTKLAELPAWLAAHPFCELTDTLGETELVRFGRDADGGLWFTGEHRAHYLPIRCGIGHADRHETGVELDERGFTLTKFGRPVRVDYLVSPGR